jgi:hypothetical protein
VLNFDVMGKQGITNGHANGRIKNGAFRTQDLMG